MKKLQPGPQGARAGNALTESVSENPKTRVNQVFPGPLGLLVPRVRFAHRSVK